MILIDDKVRKYYLHYILQCFLAGITIAIILLSLNLFTQEAIIAALGSSVFIVFAMPKNVTARARNLIGGHTIGVICGVLCSWLLSLRFNGQTLVDDKFFFIFFIALGITLSIFVMCLTNTEHPPASGTAMGLIIHKFVFGDIVFILAGVVLLALIKYLLRNMLRDLL